MSDTGYTRVTFGDFLAGVEEAEEAAAAAGRNEDISLPSFSSEDEDVKMAAVEGAKQPSPGSGQNPAEQQQNPALIKLEPNEIQMTTLVTNGMVTR